MKPFILILFLLSSLLPHSAEAFDFKWKRYLSHHDVLRTLRHHFSQADLKKIGDDCLYSTEKNKLLIGVFDHDSGKPVFQKPTAGFLSWFVSCSKEFVESDFEKRNQNGTLSTDYFAGISQLNRKWIDLTRPQKNKIVTHLLHRLIGPQVIADEDQRVRELVQMVNQTANPLAIPAAGKKLILAILLQEEFLAY